MSRIIDTLVEVVGKGRYATVEELLNVFHNAAARADFNTYFGCFHPQGRFLGSDKTENWTMSEFAKYVEPLVEQAAGWAYEPLPDSRTINYFNDCTLAIFDELMYQESLSATFRGSGSLLRDTTSGCWLLLSYHLTIPIPNEIATDVCRMITKEEKRVQFQEKAAASDAAARALLEELDAEQHELKGSAKKTKKKGKK